MTEKRMTQTDIVTRAIRDGQVETITVGPRAVGVTTKGDVRYILPMSEARTSKS